MCVRVLQQRGGRVQRPYMRHVLFCVALRHTVQSMAWRGMACQHTVLYMQDEVVCVADFGCCLLL